MDAIEVKLCGHWYSAKIMEDDPECPLCVVKFSPPAVQQEIVSLTIRMPHKRIRMPTTTTQDTVASSATHKSKASFAEVVNMFGDEWDDGTGGMYNTNNHGPGNRGFGGSAKDSSKDRRVPTGTGGIEGLFQEMEAMNAPSNNKSRRKPTAGGIDGLFDDGPSINSTPASHHGRQPTGNAEMIQKVNHARRMSRQQPSFSGVMALFNGDEDEIEDALGKKIPAKKPAAGLTLVGSESKDDDFSKAFNSMW